VYTCGVSTSGAGYCWGSSSNGELGNGTTDGEIVLKEIYRGTIRGTAKPTLVSGRHVFRSISTDRTSFNHTTCGVTVEGAALCWGSTERAEEALGHEVHGDEWATPGQVYQDTLSFLSVSVGGDHVCGVVKDGSVYCWGGNKFGQLGDASTMSRMEPQP